MKIYLNWIVQTFHGKPWKAHTADSPHPELWMMEPWRNIFDGMWKQKYSNDSLWLSRMSPDSKGAPVEKLGANVMEESLHVWPFHIFILSPLSGSQQSQWSFWGLRDLLNTTLPFLQLLLLTDWWTSTAGPFLVLIHNDLLGHFVLPIQFVVSFLDFNPIPVPAWFQWWFQCWSHGLWPWRDRIQPHFFALPLPDPSLHDVLLCGQLLKNAGFGIVSARKPQITHCTVQSPLLEPLTNLTRSL